LNFIYTVQLKVPVTVKKEVFYKEMVEKYLNKDLVKTIVCPEGSRRNPTHLSGSVIHQVLKENHYYVVTPDSSQSWEYVTDVPDFPRPENVFVELGVATELNNAILGVFNNDSYLH